MTDDRPNPNSTSRSWDACSIRVPRLIADGVVHAVGIVLAIAAGSALLALAAFRTGPGEYVAAAFYVVSLLTVLSVSLAYNLWPIVAGEMDPEALRPCRDLSADRRRPIRRFWLNSTISPWPAR